MSARIARVIMRILRADPLIFLKRPGLERLSKPPDCFGFSEAPFISTSDLTRR